MRPSEQTASASKVPRQWLLKRNCALSPRQLALFYATLVAVSMLIGAGFASVGAWLILPFAGLEMLALGAALLHYARHAGDRECVVLEDDSLRVEVVRAGCSESVRFNPQWVRVEAEGRPGTPGVRVWLQEGGRRWMVGRFVGEDQRAVFASELGKALAGLRVSAAGRTDYDRVTRTI